MSSFSVFGHATGTKYQCSRVVPISPASVASPRMSIGEPEVAGAFEHRDIAARLSNSSASRPPGRSGGPEEVGLGSSTSPPSVATGSSAALLR